MPLPRSTTPAEPTTPRLLTVSSMLPPHFPRRRLQRLICREGVDPLDRCKRFQVIHPPFLDLAWRKGSFIFEPSLSFTSFDHLVGDGKQRWREAEVKCPGGIEVDYAIKHRDWA